MKQHNRAAVTPLYPAQTATWERLFDRLARIGRAVQQAEPVRSDEPKAKPSADS